MFSFLRDLYDRCWYKKASSVLDFLSEEGGWVEGAALNKRFDSFMIPVSEILFALEQEGLVEKEFVRPERDTGYGVYAHSLVVHHRYKVDANHVGVVLELKAGGR